MTLRAMHCLSATSVLASAALSRWTVREEGGMEVGNWQRRWGDQSLKRRKAEAGLGP